MEWTAGITRDDVARRRSGAADGVVGDVAIEQTGVERWGQLDAVAAVSQPTGGGGIGTNEVALDGRGDDAAVAGREEDAILIVALRASGLFSPPLWGRVRVGGGTAWPA
jgi:hypothetical protein